MINDGVQTKVHVKDGDMVLERVQDCVPIAEYAKARHNEGLFGSKDMRLAASIPNVIIERYCNDNNLLYSEVMGNPVHMRRIVKDPANAHFRVWKGNF